MKVSVLAENSAGRSHARDCLAEWGLSLYLDVGDVRILFDSGHKGTFSQNADKLGVDLDTVDFVVLSHHHWDHTGGLRFRKFEAKKKLVTHPRVPETVLAQQSILSSLHQPGLWNFHPAYITWGRSRDKPITKKERIRTIRCPTTLQLPYKPTKASLS